MTRASLRLALPAAVLPSLPVAAQRKEAAPDVREGVDGTEHPDAQVPLDLEFVQSDGKSVKLGDFFVGTRTVLLTMNYSNCPKRCSVQLNGLVAAMKNMPWNTMNSMLGIL